MLIPQTALTAGKHALLIGIQDYSKTSFDSLQGPFNDIRLTKGVLRERFGFQNDDFIIIKDATHTGIEKAFKKLINRVNPNDFVYIYYSGHGSQTKDLNGDERSGYDQTWVSYGARSGISGIDNYDVLDDEIEQWLSALTTKNIVFISDSCHSATVTRGPAVINKAVKKDERPHLLGKIHYQATPYGIHIGAAGDDESAFEERQEDGKYYSVFTWYFTQNLQNAQPGETWNDVFMRTYAQVTAKRGMAQRPQIRGEHRRQVLGPDFTALSPRIKIRVAYPNYVGIQAGSLLGVTKGSVYRLYKPNSQNLPSLTIQKVIPFASYGKPKPRGAFKINDLVVEESHAYHFTPFKVYLEADLDKPLLKKIAAAFDTQALSAYQVTDDPHQANLHLYLLRPKNGQPNEALPQSFPNQPLELWVLTPDQRLFKKGLKIPFDNPKEGVKSLQDKLKKIARVRELKGLQSPFGNTLPMELKVKALIQVPYCQKGQDCLEKYNRKGEKVWYRKTGAYRFSEIGGKSFNKGEILSFTLHNTSKQSYYAYLINISPDDGINILFPPHWEIQEFARFQPGEKLDVINTLNLTDIGEETLKLIISPQAINIWLLQQPPVTRAGLNPLEHLLLNVTDGWRGRRSIKVDKWAAGQVIFKVSQ
jgi:hypothetical protein